MLFSINHIKSPTLVPKVLILAFTTFCFGWFIFNEINTFFTSQTETAKSSVQGISNHLTQTLKLRRFSVKGLVEKEQDLLSELADFPVNSSEFNNLQSIVKNRTYDAFTFMIANSEGEPLLSENLDKIGPICKTGIKLFSRAPHLHSQTVIIHGNSNKDYHFDVMQRIGPNPDDGIFFISFKADSVIELIQNASTSNQILLLVKDSNPSEIEISSDGVYTSKVFGKKLSNEVLNSVLFYQPIPETGWRVLSILQPGVFSSFLQKLLFKSFLVLMVLSLITVFLMRRIRKETAQKNVAKIALEKSRERLKDKVFLQTQAIVEHENNLQKTFMGAPFGMIISNGSGIIELANEQACMIFGYSLKELVGQAVEVLLPEEGRESHKKQRKHYNEDPQVRAMGKGSYLLGLRKDGHQFPVEIGLSPVNFNDETKIIASISDVSELSRAQEKLATEHERAMVTLSSIGDGVITTNIDAEIDSMNPVAEKLTGWSSNDALGLQISDVFGVISESTKEKVANPILVCLKEKKTVELSAKTLLVHKKGMEIPIDNSASPIFDSDGFIIGAVLIFHDVTQYREHAREIEYHANHDALTGLLNRREFDSRFIRSLQQARENQHSNILLFLDLDRFKQVNDTAGHAAGDKLLKELSQLMISILRQRDMLARLGGDEFGILLEHCSVDVGFKVANKIRSAVEDFRFYWEDDVFSVGVSIGMVPYPNNGESADELLSEADAACYTAKETGRNRVHAYDASSAQKRSESSIVNLLSDAFEKDRMQLFQQTIMASDPSQANHHEILIRMFSENGDILPPGTFLPAAERYGLATTLDRWVIRSSFSWLQQQQSQSSEPLYLSINLSSQSLTDATFKDYINSKFLEMGIDSSCICFEITETAAMSNLSLAIDFITDLKQLGCQFALDDFGSGHASYGHLKHLPVDYLKIDGIFVKEIDKNPIDLSIVKSINDVSHVLGLKTIAEFVENDAIRQILTDIGVDYLQGYGIARPAPINDLIKK